MPLEGSLPSASGNHIVKNIRAIGFDLFNTLITVGPNTLAEAMDRLIRSLRNSGITIEEISFKKAYLDRALKFVDRAKREGRETHNRFWISAALGDGGTPVLPDDDRISSAVECYFSAFYENIHPIPGAEAMLDALRSRYSLGLLSNFTHGPAAREILKCAGLNPYFKTILISGELGFRKPHPAVFRELAEGLDAPEDQILYIGDDPEPDIHGARKAGLKPVWMTYVRDRNLPQVRGILKGEKEIPDFEVPRISSWRDLFSLMDIHPFPLT